MKPKEAPKPTPGELAILQVLWRLGPSTVRQVHAHLAAPGVYTTTLKLMQIMADKGLVEREESGRAHLYRAAAGREETEGTLVEELADRVFGGSAGRLALRALARRRATPEELAEIRRIIEEAEGDKK